MNKAVFLDRDGVLIREVGHLHHAEDLEIYPFAKKSVSRLKKLGFRVIVLSNQGAIALGLCSEAFVRRMNSKIKKATGVNAIYYCPHRPEGKIHRYVKKCKCRKPEIGMIMNAKKRYKIDLKKSYMIGDMTSDIKMGKKAGCKTILVKTGAAGRDKRHSVKPDYIAKNLGDATWIIEKHEKQDKP